MRLRSVRLNLAVAWFLLLNASLLTGACSNDVDQITSSIDNAVRVFEGESSAWRTSFTTISQELPADIREEAQKIADKAIGAAGKEVRCSINFIRGRVIQDFKRLQAKMMGKTPDPPALAVCMVTPDRINLDMSENDPTINIIGYDLNSDSLRLVVASTDGSEVELSSADHLSRLHHYELILNLKPGGGPLQLSDKSRRIAVLDNGKLLTEIPIFDETPTGEVPSERVGGRGGRLAFRVVPETARIKSIDVRSGKYVDQLKVTWDDPAVPTLVAGGNGGSPSQTIHIEEDEHLLEVFGKAGMYIDAIGFRTDKHVYGPFGGAGGNPFELKAQPGFEIVNFRTQSGYLLDSIQVYQRRIPR